MAQGQPFPSPQPLALSIAAVLYQVCPDPKIVRDKSWQETGLSACVSDTSAVLDYRSLPASNDVLSLRLSTAYLSLAD